MIHLTEDQIDDLLIGDAPAETTSHLATCSDCTARLAALQQPVASFNAASLAWGERRSATLPLQLRPASAGLVAGGRLRLAMGATAAGILALTLALPLLHHGSAMQAARETTPRSAPPQTVQTAAIAPTTVLATDDSQTQASDQQQIDRDNQLLQAIDRELAASETPADLVRMTGQQDTHQSSPGVTHNE